MHTQIQKFLRIPNPQGFTLIEILVAVGLFVVVMVIALGALLGIVNADSRAQAVGYMANNIDFVFDDISRNLRTGFKYSCDASGTVEDCPDGSQTIAFKNQSGDYVAYWFSPQCLTSPVGGTERPGYGGNGCIEESSDGTSWTPITSPTLAVDDMEFFVTGTGAFPDPNQPSVFIRFSAHLLETKPGTSFAMHLQTRVTQRVYDN